MLPGFRFLFTAILLSVSMLIFGLGAAALLRASHEQFLSLPTVAVALPPLPQDQHTMPDPAPPTLALLQLADPAGEAPAVSGSMSASSAEPPAEAISPAEPSTAAGTPEGTAEASAPTGNAPAPPAHMETPPSSQPAVQPEMAAVPAADGMPAPIENSAVAAEPEAMPPGPTPAEGKLAASSTNDAAETTKPVAPLPADSDQPAAAPTPTQDSAAVEKTESHPAAADATSSAAPDTPPPAATSEAAAPAPADTPAVPTQTAMLANEQPAGASELPPPVVIEGPVPLPPSRAWALAQGKAHASTAKPKRVVARQQRTRPVPRMQRPATAPAAAPIPNGLLFPFDQR